MKQTEKNDLVQYILSKNAYNTKTTHFNSIGFKTEAYKYGERNDLYHVGELFLVNSYLKRNDVEQEVSIASYLTDDGMKMVSLSGQRDVTAFPKIKLTAGYNLNLALGEAITRRRSIRNFTGDLIEKKSIVTVLRAMAGISATAEVELENGESIEFNLRTVPSGGGLQPIEVFVAVLQAQGLERGIYRYSPVTDELLCIGNDALLEKLLAGFDGPVNLVKSSQANVVFLFVSKPWRSMRKYGYRGLRFVFHEAGAMAQNLHLACVALGLGSVDCAGFYEDELHQALHFDGMYSCVIHTVLVGSIA